MVYPPPGSAARQCGQAPKGRNIPDRGEAPVGGGLRGQRVQGLKDQKDPGDQKGGLSTPWERRTPVRPSPEGAKHTRPGRSPGWRGFKGQRVQGLKDEKDPGDQRRAWVVYPPPGSAARQCGQAPKGRNIPDRVEAPVGGGLRAKGFKGPKGSRAKGRKGLSTPWERECPSPEGKHTRPGRSPGWLKDEKDQGTGLSTPWERRTPVRPSPEGAKHTRPGRSPVGGGLRGQRVQGLKDQKDPGDQMGGLSTPWERRTPVRPSPEGAKHTRRGGEHTTGAKPRLAGVFGLVQTMIVIQ